MILKLMSKQPEKDLYELVKNRDAQTAAGPSSFCPNVVRVHTHAFNKLLVDSKRHPLGIPWWASG